MSGRLTLQTPQEHIALIRSRSSYNDFKTILALMRGGDYMAALKEVDGLLNRKRAYRSVHNAIAAEESMELVLREEGLWRE